jgi:RimJ/RimL family protein N-acetyltransferase
MQAVLETERLVFRRFTEADVDNLFDLDGDPAVMRFISGGAPTPRRVIEAEVLPRFLRSYARDDGFGVWAAVEKSTGNFLGWFSLQPRDGASSVEATLGYRLRQSAWGQGYATEGVRALIHEGFAELGVRRMIASTYQDNLASRRVMEKAGLTLVRRFRLTAADLAAIGTFDAASQDIWDGNEVEYALEKADWEMSGRAAT